MRASLALVIVATSVAGASPPKDDPPKPRPTTPDDAKVAALLDKIGGDAAARKKASEELDAQAPDAIANYLARTHATSTAERRKILDAIKASVPDKSGRFSQPQRMKESDEKADEAFDWLAHLVDLDVATIPAGKTPEDLPKALAEVIADDVAIRALAHSKDFHAAQLIFDASFDAETTIYRDECGRYLRKMEPLSIPALTREAQGKSFDRARYASYQLERLDRQEPLHALNAATDNEALTIAVLDVFRTTKHREAVHAVWTKVDDPSPRVREAARAAWLAYVTGDPPPPAPRRKLQLPGGKLTKVPKPLWLTYRELADNELRKAANELLHEDYPLDDPTLDDIERAKKTVKVDIEDLTKRLFAYYDGERTKKEAAEWTTAKAKADAGDLASATTLLDQQLAKNPERSEHVAMAKIYFTWARQLDDKQQWDAAAAAYSKAHGLDPKGANANDALAGHHYALGKALEAQGKDGGAEYRQAVALKPDYAQAKTAAAAAAPSDRPAWMLYAAAGAGGLALLLFGTAMLLRRRAA
jgi:hypothetical protein